MVLLDARFRYGGRARDDEAGRTSTISSGERDPQRPRVEHEYQIRPSADQRRRPTMPARWPAAAPRVAAGRCAGAGCGVSRRSERAPPLPAPASAPGAPARSAVAASALGAPPRALLAHRAQRHGCTQLRSSAAPGVAGLLRVELGGRTAARARPRRRTARRGSRWSRAPRRRRASASGAPRTSARSRTARRRAARRTAPSRPAPSTVFQPMCGTRSARRAGSPRRAAGPSPLVTTPCSSPESNRICMPTQMPSTGRPARDPVGDHRAGAERRRCRPCRPRTRRRPARRARRRAAAASRSAVTVTSAPARASARSAERRLPEP